MRLTTGRSLRLMLGIAGFTLGCGGEGAPTNPVTRAADRPSLASSQLEAWSAPVSLGPVVNFGNTDNSPELSRDGLSLYFGSVNRPGGFGSTDLWVSRRACTDIDDAQCA